jgi:hypothetical protein
MFTAPVVSPVVGIRTIQNMVIIFVLHQNFNDKNPDRNDIPTP